MPFIKLIFMKKFIALLIAPVFLVCSLSAQQTSIVGPGKAVDPYRYSQTKTATFKHAAIATAHPLASEVGAEIMRMGGNAFDASIASQLALAVVYPGAGNLGGGGFLLAREKNGKLIAIDFRETAPAKASKDMYLDAQGNAIDSLSKNGHLSGGVPGTVAGIFSTIKYAKLPFQQLIQPAIDLAKNGFAITEREARSLNYNKADFITHSTRASALVKSGSWKMGDTLVQPELAATLERIRDKGQKGFYEGETARLIVEEMQRGNGIISYDDLKHYKAEEREPIQFDYRGYRVISFPPPSSGGLLLAEMLGMIEDYDIGQYGFQTSKSVQLMVEAERRAYADRAEHMGDPGFWNVPVKTLMSRAYLRNRMSNFQFGVAGKSEDIKPGNIHESRQTTHLSIMDDEGNMVAVTTTLNNSYGSKTVIGGAGFLLNDEMDDFSVKPGVPNMYGAVGGAANAIAPGKRMLSSMTPTILLKNNKPFMVVGTPGGTTIPTSVYQSIINVIDFGMNAEDAVNKPKFHHQWLPDEIMVEKNFPASTVGQLEEMGYKIVRDGSIGRTELILIDSNGSMQTAADKRGDDSASGY